MKNSKLTKLVALATVLLVSVATLAGSTVAWFTDTEEVVNTIQSGDLDIELEFAKVANGTVGGWNEAPMQWNELESSTTMFNENALYEPGYTEVALLKVRNAGNLALQYKLSLDANNTEVGESVQQNANPGTGDPIYLSDHLKLAAFPVESEEAFKTILDSATDKRAAVRNMIGDTVTNGADGTGIPYISDGFKNETRPAKNAVTTLTEATADIAPAVIQSIVGGEAKKIENIELWPKNTASVGSDEDMYALVLYMPEEVGNEANNRKVEEGKIVNPTIQLGIKLEAAQVVEESDSFDNQYDLNATYDGAVYAADSTEFAAYGGGPGNTAGYTPDATPEVTAAPTVTPTADPGDGGSTDTPAAGEKVNSESDFDKTQYTAGEMIFTHYYLPVISEDGSHIDHYLTTDMYSVAGYSQGTAEQTILTVPSTAEIGGVTKTVAAIETFAFNQDDTLETIILPDTILEIRYQAFKPGITLKVGSGTQINKISETSFTTDVHANQGVNPLFTVEFDGNLEAWKKTPSYATLKASRYMEGEDYRLKCSDYQTPTATVETYSVVTENVETGLDNWKYTSSDYTDIGGSDYVALSYIGEAEVIELANSNLKIKSWNEDGTITAEENQDGEYNPDSAGFFGWRARELKDAGNAKQVRIPNAIARIAAGAIHVKPSEFTLVLAEDAELTDVSKDLFADGVENDGPFKVVYEGPESQWILKGLSFARSGLVEGVDYVMLFNNEGTNGNKNYAARTYAYVKLG